MTDETEIEQLLDDNATDLHRYLLRRLADPEDAAEALNDVRLVAWRRRDRVPPDAHEGRLWLFGVAANVQRNQQRARQRRSALARLLTLDPTTRSAGGHARDSVSDPASDPAVGSAADRVRDAIDALPHDLAELVRLHHWEGFALVEVATILDVPASTVRTRYAAARRRLRLALGPVEDDESGRDRRIRARAVPQST